MSRPPRPILSARALVGACAGLLAFAAGVALAPLPSCSALRSASGIAPPRWVGAAGNEIRVRLAARLDRASLEAPSAAEAFIAGSAAEPVAFTGRATFEWADGAVRLHASSGAVIGAFAGDAPLVVSARSEGVVRFDGYEARRILLRAVRRAGQPGRAFDVVEVVDVDRYVAAVLTAELYAGWSQATYDAQAIAARTYAMHERWRRRRLGSHFDVEADTRDQAYARVASQQARRAVERTRGQALAHNGALLRAYYSSTCGGRPASAADTWPTGPGYEFNLAPPIQAHERSALCQASPRFRWTVERDRNALWRRLAAFGADRGYSIRRLRSLTRIEPARRNPAGRPAEYRVIDDRDKWWTLSAENLRLALNFSGQGAPPLPDGARVHSGDVEIRVDKRRVIIEGRGFGHGVGMCQFGAEALARQGLTPEEILMFFYPGARLVMLPSGEEAL